MQMEKSNMAHRAWKVLLLAVSWARKASVLKRKIMLNLSKYIKRIRHNMENSSRHDILRYMERQLSFDDTPLFHVQMHWPQSLCFKLPHIPCITPAKVDFSQDFNDDNDGFYCNEVNKENFLKNTNEEEYYGYGEPEISEEVNCNDQGIDVKAEKFIANFYEQVKLQRQISRLQYLERQLITVD